jgi:hypothetical protein
VGWGIVDAVPAVVAWVAIAMRLSCATHNEPTAKHKIRVMLHVGGEFTVQPTMSAMFTTMLPTGCS